MKSLADDLVVTSDETVDTPEGGTNQSEWLDELFAYCCCSVINFLFTIVGGYKKQGFTVLCL